MGFPQRYRNIAIKAKPDGRHPSKFQPSFPTGQCDGAKRFAAFDGVDTCRDKLKKPNQNTPVCPVEKGVDLFCQIIHMLSPASGTVLYVMSGSLTTSLAFI